MNEAEFFKAQEAYAAADKANKAVFRAALYRRLWCFVENHMKIEGARTLDIEFERLSSDWFSVNLVRVILENGDVVSDFVEDDDVMDAFSSIAYDLAEGHLLAARTPLVLSRIDGEIVASQQGYSERISLV